MPGLSWGKLVDEADVAEEKVLDPGEYDLILKSVKYKTTKNGDPMFNCRYAVESGPHKGTTVWDNITILRDPAKKVGLQINMRKLYNLGADIKFLQTEPDNDEIIKRIEGSRIIATLEISEWNGNERNEIKTFKVNKEAAPAQKTAAAAPAPKAQSPSEEYAASAPSANVETEAEEVPKTTTKKRGTIPLPPAP